LACLDDLTAALAPRLDELLTPALVIDLDAVDHNTAAMLARVGARARWRPHIKTLKQSFLVKGLMHAGIGRLKCATLDELALALDTAERVHPEGEIDVMLAYPPHRGVLGGVLGLLAEHEGARVRIVADAPDHLEQLAAWVAEHGAADHRRLSVMLEVDTGMHRTGSAPAVWHAAMPRVHALTGLRLSGLHGYEGHVGWDDADAARQGYDALVELAKAMAADDVECIVTSGTHAYRHALGHPGLAAGPWRHEVSPGTVVLSDLHSGPAARDLGLRQAAFVLTRVVSQPDEGRITVDAGSKGIAPDRPAPSCRVLGWPGLTAQTPSEEHLPLTVDEAGAPARGTALLLVPDHVCTTVNLYRQVIYVRGPKWAGIGDIEAHSRTLRLSDRRP
jgi:D-serine deaminase-like pyridoxal phosphate-dependent protein